jgi:hypothetical protein
VRSQFLAAHAHAVIVCDFLVVETVLLRQLHVLVFTGHGTRRLHLAGVTAHPTGAWAVQQARSRQQQPAEIETQPVRNVADLRSVRRKPVVAGLINEYHYAT